MTVGALSLELRRTALCALVVRWSGPDLARQVAGVQKLNPRGRAWLKSPGRWGSTSAPASAAQRAVASRLAGSPLTARSRASTRTTFASCQGHTRMSICHWMHEPAIRIGMCKVCCVSVCTYAGYVQQEKHCSARIALTPYTLPFHNHLMAQHTWQVVTGFQEIPIKAM